MGRGGKKRGGGGVASGGVNDPAGRALVYSMLVRAGCKEDLPLVQECDMFQ